MLEQPALLLQPWAPDAGGTCRTILAAGSRAPLGKARRTCGAVRWLPGVRRPRVAVYETEDESLVCTVEQRWGWAARWEVCEADGHLVGRVRRPGWPRGRRGELRLEDFGRRDVALLTRGPEGEDDSFLDSHGMELGTLGRIGDEARLTFSVWLRNDPFARMLLLAAALVGEW